MLYFAWISSHSTPFDPVAHARQDLAILDLVISEEEGLAPSFTLEVANPGIAGILSSGHRYALISEQSAGDAEPILLARGKVAGCPSELSGATISLEFTCVGPDADEALTDFADTLRTDDSSYDPIFVSESEAEAPESALMGRPESFYWDRKTLEIGTSHMIEGGRVVDLGGQVLEGLKVRLTEPPVRHAKLTVSCGWEQRARGTMSLKPAIGPAISSFTYEDVESWWPAEGASLGDGGGWTMSESELGRPTEGLSGEIPGGTYEDDPLPGGYHLILRKKTYTVKKLTARYEYSQQREEVLTLLGEVGIQDVLGDDRVSELSDISLRDPSYDATTPEWEPIHIYDVGDRTQHNGKCFECAIAHTSVDFWAEYVSVVEPSGFTHLERQWSRVDSQAPLSDPRRASFFSTARGRRSVEFGIEVLRKHLLSRARCVEITCDVPWALGRDLTVDDSVRVETTKIPGGEAVGKLTRLELRADDQGIRIASLTIACSVGTGEPSPAPDFGTSDYFDDDYGPITYGPTVTVADRETASGVVYAWPDLQPSQPVNAFRLGDRPYSIIESTLRNQANSQELEARWTGLTGGNPVQALAENPTRWNLRLRPLPQSDVKRLKYLVSCQPMECNQGINLGATA